MTIREELKENYVKHMSNWKKQHKLDLDPEVSLEEQARVFFNRVLIPKFKEISLRKPTCDYFYIQYDYGKNWIWYISNVDPLTNLGHDGPVEEHVIEKAVQISKKEFDIDATREEDGKYGTKYLFYIDLSELL